MASESKQDVIEPTERTTIRRLPKRQVVDKVSRASDSRLCAARDPSAGCVVCPLRSVCTLHWTLV